jgi:WD40 repeat protein
MKKYVAAPILMGLSAAVLFGQSLRPVANLETPVPMKSTITCEDGAQVLGFTADDETYAWSLPSGKPRKVSGSVGRINATGCGGTKTLALGLKGNVVVVLDSETGAERRRIDAKHPVDKVAVSDDGSLLAIVTTQAPVQVWDARGGKNLWNGSSNFGSTAGAAFSPSGDLLISADGDTNIRAYDRKGKLLYTVDGGLLEPFDVSFSADGKKFVVAGAEGSITVYDSASGKMLGKSKSKGNPIWGLIMAPDGRAVVALEVDDYQLNPVEIARWDVTGEGLIKLDVDAKTVIGAGKTKENLFLLTQEAPGKIAVRRLD